MKSEKQKIQIISNKTMEQSKVLTVNNAALSANTKHINAQILLMGQIKHKCKLNKKSVNNIHIWLRWKEHTNNGNISTNIKLNKQK